MLGEGWETAVLTDLMADSQFVRGKWRRKADYPVTVKKAPLSKTEW